MVEYKLYYFNIRGRAELIRILFAAAGVKYEDIRFEKDNWADYKGKTPFGQVPFLEVHDGSNELKLSQSLAITRYLAKKFGLAGKDENEQATMEMYGEQITDLANELVKAYKETDETRKEEMTKKLTTEVIPFNFKLFEEKVASSGSGFFAASGLTWIDLYLYVLLEWLAEKKAAILPHFPHIKALDEKIASHPNVAEWLKSRPVTPM